MIVSILHEFLKLNQKHYLKTCDLSFSTVGIALRVEAGRIHFNLIEMFQRDDFVPEPKVLIGFNSGSYNNVDLALWQPPFTIKALNTADSEKVLRTTFKGEPQLRADVHDWLEGIPRKNLSVIVYWQPLPTEFEEVGL